MTVTVASETAKPRLRKPRVFINCHRTLPQPPPPHPAPQTCPCSLSIVLCTPIHSRTHFTHILRGCIKFGPVKILQQSSFHGCWLAILVVWRSVREQFWPLNVGHFGNFGEGNCESTIAARQWGVNFCREALRCLAGPSGKVISNQQIGGAIQKSALFDAVFAFHGLWFVA